MRRKENQQASESIDFAVFETPQWKGEGKTGRQVNKLTFYYLRHPNGGGKRRPASKWIIWCLSIWDTPMEGRREDRQASEPIDPPHWGRDAQNGAQRWRLRRERLDMRQLLTSSLVLTCHGAACKRSSSLPWWWAWRPIHGWGKKYENVKFPRAT